MKRNDVSKIDQLNSESHTKSHTESHTHTEGYCQWYPCDYQDGQERSAVLLLPQEADEIKDLVVDLLGALPSGHLVFKEYGAKPLILKAPEVSVPEVSAEELEAFVGILEAEHPSRPRKDILKELDSRVN